MQSLLFGLQKSQTSRLELMQSAAGAFSQVQRSADTSPPHRSNCNSCFLISRPSSKFPWFYGLFRHLLQPIVLHTSWARSTPGYRKRLEYCLKRAADHSPSRRIVTRASHSLVISAVQFSIERGYYPAHFQAAAGLLSMQKIAH